MEFYKSLQCDSIYFGIVLTPFEAFIMKYSEWGHGLCLCGLGVKCSLHMGHALFAILQQLLPTSNSFIESQLELVGNDSNNGFNLLWLLQKRFITMFDLTKELSWPEWHDDIFRYAKRVLMHCDLSCYSSTMYTGVTCSLLFLCGLQGRYKDNGMSYISMILAYQQEHGESAQLPTHLMTLALVQTLTDVNYGRMAPDIATTSWALRISTNTPPSSTPGEDFAIHTQGFVAMKAELQGNRGGNTRGPRGPLRAAPNVVLTECRRRAAPRLSCYQGTCNACGQWGHPANASNKVGAWVFLRWYHRDRTNMAMIEEPECAWVEKNKPYLRDKEETPKKIFYTFCERMGIGEDQVIKEVDWDFFSDNDANKE
jgi:hypothetical protein